MTENLQKLIEKTLKEYEMAQINLASQAARESLAKQITQNIQGKYYVVAYSSQESFE